MRTNARVALRACGWACTPVLLVAATACSSTPQVAGIPYAGSGTTTAAVSVQRVLPSALEARPRAPKHCCIVVATAASSGANVRVYHNAKPYKYIANVTYPTQDPDPEPVAVSRSGVVYVGDLLAGAVYAFGNGYQKAPTATYLQSGPSGTGVPRSLAIGQDGTLYVGDQLYQGSEPIGNVVQVFPSGSGQAHTLAGPPNAIDSAGVAVDAHGDVYAAANASLPSNPSQKFVQLIEYPAGSPSGTVLNLTAPARFARAIAVDSAGNVLIGDFNGSCGLVLVFPPGKTQPARTIGKSCALKTAVSGLALTERDTLYVSNGFGNQVAEYSYPRGKRIGVLSVQNSFTIVGLGVGPAVK
jgi:hypothetical protein